MDLVVLKQTFKGEIKTDSETLTKFSRDASIFEIRPAAVVSPQDSADVKALVKFAAEQKAQHPELSLTARAGGTDMTGGSISESIIVNVEHLNNITNLTATSVETGSGVFFRDLEPKLIAKNVIMPAYPVSKAWCAVGGMVGNNAGGEKTFKYGQIKNYVEQLKVVLADGNEYTIKPLSEAELKAKLNQTDFEGQLYKKIFELIQTNYRLIQKAKPTTSKNSAGYFLWDVWDGQTFDLTKLFVGSQGTLGIITNIKWRLVPIERGRQLIVFYLHDLKLLGEIINHVNELVPESFEIFDDQTFRLALKYWPEMIKRMKGSRLKLLRQFLPDMWLWLRGGLPKLVLLAEFTAPTQTEAVVLAETAAKNLKEHFNLPVRICRTFEELQKYWTMRRESYNLLRQHNARKVSAPFIEDITVHPDQLPKFMPELNAIIKRYPDFVSTLAGHAGDANFHIIPLIDLSTEQHREQIIQMSNEVFALVKKYDGTITGEHNDGLVRGPYLSEMFGPEVFALFKQVKQIFDPNNLFNPHKKTDADMDYYSQHLRHN
ncbi:MAG TPA: FAD-binding oxidoreductase [Candidatus Doudnabacteria bacterium]|nr:FAD-binding oxidoreductase [Candidatus Doudnabacteria bacterium]